MYRGRAVKDTVSAATVCKRKFAGTASCRRADHGKMLQTFSPWSAEVAAATALPHREEPSESPRHFADSMDESVIVGY